MTYLKRWLSLIVFLSFLIIGPESSWASDHPIQQMIEDAKEGDTVHIPEGSYNEPITIDKQIHLIGNGKVIFNINEDKPAISIKADKVTLQNIAINYQSEVPNETAILIEGDQNTLSEIEIVTNQRGIFLDESHQNILENISLEGPEHLPIQARQRGIDLWKSDQNVLRQLNITNVEDGIYIESSAANEVYKNKVTKSRYGYHLMFTKKTKLHHNESHENISGMMVMGTNETQVHDNLLTHNQKDVQSLGLLLFDVKNAVVENNEIAHNRLGIFIESAKDNTLIENDVRNNFIGLQFKFAENNVIEGNAFSANAVQGQAEESANNKTNLNYWSDHQGLDRNGNGQSDLSYKVDPFYLHLTNEYPAFRLLFQSPGMIFLDNMMHTPVEQQLVDQTPLMENPLVDHDLSQEKNLSFILISSILFVFSLTSIFFGVKK